MALQVVRVRISDALGAQALLLGMAASKECHPLLVLERVGRGVVVVHSETSTVLGRLPARHPLLEGDPLPPVAKFEISGNSQYPLRCVLRVLIESNDPNLVGSEPGGMQ